MKEIKLNKGFIAFVDDEDYDWINQWKWFVHKNKSGHVYYAIRQFHIDGKEKMVRMHRMIFEKYSKESPAIIDHKDGNGLNNQKYNLREASKAQNSINRNRGRKQYRGAKRVVSYKKDGSISKIYFVSRIYIGKHDTYLGIFENEIDAHIAYKKATIKYFGEFSPYWKERHEFGF